jgi:ADP-heptose:LPS heptosyltransferase
MIYRPVVLRKEWDSRLRNPDPQHYEDIYRAVRDGHYVISIASLKTDVEWIVGREQDADLKIHDGTLEMWEMAALFAEADVVFCNAGMAPVLAQAVGTPSIVVYGGRESFRTSQRAGAHLAPTLGIDTIDPCDCHSHTHNCCKTIDVPKALVRVREFIHENVTVRHDLRRHRRKDDDPAMVDALGTA